jgi:putative transposase
MGPRFLIFDRDAKYELEVPIAIYSIAIRPIRNSFRSPWQNGIAERWVESCRRDLLDHVIAINERHLKRLFSDYVHYYHEDRTHLGLDKETPSSRVVAFHVERSGHWTCKVRRSAPSLRPSRLKQDRPIFR